MLLLFRSSKVSAANQLPGYLGENFHAAHNTSKLANEDKLFDLPWLMCIN